MDKILLGLLIIDILMVVIFVTIILLKKRSSSETDEQKPTERPNGGERPDDCKEPDVDGEQRCKEFELIQQLLPNSDDNLENFHQFGRSVSIDNEFAIVGAWAVDDERGAAYIYQRNPDFSFINTITLVGDNEGDLFGQSVSIDGNFAIIGASGVDDERGAVYIYRKNAEGIWDLEPVEILNGETEGDLFGQNVSIDGDFAIVGASGVGNERGAAYIYQKTNQRWNPEPVATLNGETEGGLFGFSVSIDGTSAIVGAWKIIGNRGAAYIYQKNNEGVWDLITTLNGKSTNDLFGWSVSITCNSAIISAPNANVRQGVIYIYEKNKQRMWDLVTSFEGTWGVGMTPNGFYGSSVSIDGNIAIVGTFCENSLFPCFSAYIYEKNCEDEKGWRQTLKLEDDDVLVGAGPGRDCSVTVKDNSILVGSIYGRYGPQPIPVAKIDKWVVQQPMGYKPGTVYFYQNV